MSGQEPDIKGIVSRHWKRLQWISSDGYGEFFGLLEHIFISLRHHFYLLILKKKHGFAVSHLTVWQLCEWWVTAADQSPWSFLYMYNWFFIRFVTPYMTNSSVTSTAARLLSLFQTLCSISRLLYLSANKHSSPVMISGCYSTLAKLLPQEKPPRYVFFRNKDIKKSLKNVLWQNRICLICLLVPIGAILNLVLLSLSEHSAKLLGLWYN